jgi:hypothetical protein
MMLANTWRNGDNAVRQLYVISRRWRVWHGAWLSCALFACYGEYNAFAAIEKFATIAELMGEDISH